MSCYKNLFNLFTLFNLFNLVKLTLDREKNTTLWEKVTTHPNENVRQRINGLSVRGV